MHFFRPPCDVVKKSFLSLTYLPSFLCENAGDDIASLPSGAASSDSAGLPAAMPSASDSIMLPHGVKIGHVKIPFYEGMSYVLGEIPWRPVMLNNSCL